MNVVSSRMISPVMRLVVLTAMITIPLSIRAAESGIRVADLPKPSLVLEVNTSNPSNPDKNVFATLEQARDAIRALKKKGPLPPGGVAVKVQSSSYPLQNTFALGPEDSGEEGAPISYQGCGSPMTTITGWTELKLFSQVVDVALLARLPEEARGKVWQASLGSLGITKLPPARLGGYASGRGFHTTPALRLFAGEKELPLARWPNQGNISIGKLLVEDGHQIHEVPGSNIGHFTCTSDRLTRWTEDRDIILYGYWFWDWADSRELVKSINPTTKEIILEAPFHTYGFRSGQPFHATNLFSEIDQPGEWYLDRETLTLYMHSLPDWPHKNRGDNQSPSGVQLTMATATAIVAENLEHVRFQRLAWDGSAVDGIHLKNCRNVVIEGCKFSRLGGDAVRISGGSDCGVVSSDFQQLGRSGIILNGGDRKSLVPGRHFVTNCDLHQLSRVDPTYTPAVLVSGVGNILAHNRIHDMASSAMRVSGNDHVVEFNEVFNVVLESDDQGAVDMWGDPTYRGNIFRYNLWRDIGRNGDGSEPKLGHAAIRFDDAISGQLIEHNQFIRCGGGIQGFGAIQIHGGRDHLVRQNLFVACPAVATFDAWKLERWQAYVRTYFPSPALDNERYLARYPSLETLAESTNGSEFHGNLALQCKAFLPRKPVNTIDHGNQVEPAQYTLVNDRPADADLQRAGIDPTQAAKIGLYSDAWRQFPKPH